MALNTVATVALTIVTCYQLFGQPKVAVVKPRDRALEGAPEFTAPELPVRPTEEGEIEVEALKTKHHTILPYSETLGKKRILHFGNENNWGDVYVNAKKHRAFGDISHSVNTPVNWVFDCWQDKGDPFQQFKGDEFFYIELRDNGNFKNEIFKGLTKFSTLVMLRIGRNNLDYRILPYISQLKSLKGLDICHLNATAEQLRACAKLKNVGQLEFGPVPHPGIVVQELAKSSRVDDLMLQGVPSNHSCSLRDADMKALAKIPMLNKLVLKHHPLLTAKGVAELAPKHLESIVIEDANIKPSDFKHLSTLKNVKRFTLKGPDYTDADLIRLRSAMPFLNEASCRLERQGIGNLADKQIFEESLLKTLDR